MALAQISSERELAEAAPPAPKGAADPRFLLELIVADLHWMALHVGMVAMMAGACVASQSRFSLRAFRHLVYDDTRVMRLALRYFDRAGLPRESAQQLDSLYADVSVAHKQVTPFVEPVRLAPKQIEQLGRVVPNLRRISHAAADAIAGVEPHARMLLDPKYLHDCGIIREFLGRASRGDASEIDRFGVLTPPALQQRRQSPRAEVRKPCRLAFAGGETEALVVNVSREGLGLSGHAPVAAGQQVTVVIGERRLEATVARRNGQEIGLVLKRPIDLTDPLFQAG